MNAIFNNVLYEWQLMIDDFLEWWSGIYAIPKTKAYIFSFVVILLLYIIRKVFARIFLKLKSDDRYMRRMHLHTRAIKIDAPTVLSREWIQTEKYDEYLEEIKERSAKMSGSIF